MLSGYNYEQVSHINKVTTLFQWDIKTMILKTLIRESTGASDVSAARPAIAGIAQKVSRKLHNSLVHTVPTAQPIATVFAIRQLIDGVGILDADTNIESNGTLPQIPDIMDFIGTTIAVDTTFRAYKVAYKALRDIEIGAETPSDSDIVGWVFDGSIVIVNNTAGIVRSGSFSVNRVQAEIQSHTVSIPASIELLTDLDRSGVSGLSSETVISDLIGTTVAEGINRDVIDTLVAIAKTNPRFVCTDNLYEQPRQLITHINRLAAQILTDTRTPATFLLCSPKVGAALQASGQDIGLEVVVDPNAVVDYVVVGAAHDADQPSALYYCPLVTDEGSTTLLFTGDPLSLNPNYGAINRYALVIAPDLNDMKDNNAVLKNHTRESFNGKCCLAQKCLVSFLN